MATTVTPATYSAPTATTTRDALNAECIRCMLAGLPFPEGIAPRPHAAAQPSSVREGIERILGLTH